MIHGVGDGKFNPNGQMSRAEAAQVFANLLHLSDAADISAYVDVPANLEPGDILFQGINGKSIYYVGVYLGEGKLLMRQYNKDTALQETVLYDFTTTDNFADILKTGPRSEVDFSYYFVLRPSRAAEDINSLTAG